MHGIRKSIRIGVLLFLAATCAAAQDKGLGRVTGSIYDYNDAVILGTKVVISGEKVQKTAYPDPETGTFSFNVSPGTYSVTTEQNWWFPIRRAKFLVTEGKTVVINLQPTIRIASQALVIDKNGAKDVYERNSLPSLVEFIPFSDSLLNAVIEYRKSKRNGLTTKYTQAQLTYNDLSIRAEVLNFNAKTRLIKVSGNVTIDKGGLRQKKDRVTESLVPVSAQ